MHVLLFSFNSEMNKSLVVNKFVLFTIIIQKIWLYLPEQTVKILASILTYRIVGCYNILTEKVLIRLHGCAGWSGSLLFGYDIMNFFSCCDLLKYIDMSHITPPYHAEWIKMTCPLQIFSQSDYLIQDVDINSHTEWQTVQFQISWAKANWSWSTLFAKAGYILVQQDKG